MNNNALFAVQLSEIPAELATLTDAKKPLEDVRYVPFKIPKEEDPRIFRYFIGGILLFFGFLWIGIMQSNNSGSLPFYLIAFLLKAAALGLIIHAAVFMKGAAPAKDNSDIERRGVFFNADAMFTWNGEIAFYIPRQYIKSAYTEIAMNKSRSLALYFCFHDNSRWQFPRSAMKAREDFNRVIEWVKTGNMNPDIGTAEETFFQ
jgi:hypothetical protein